MEVGEIKEASKPDENVPMEIADLQEMMAVWEDSNVERMAVEIPVVYVKELSLAITAEAPSNLQGAMAIYSRYDKAYRATAANLFNKYNVEVIPFSYMQDNVLPVLKSQG